MESNLQFCLDAGIPRTPTHLSQFGNCLAKQGKFVEAEQAYRAAIESCKDYPQRRSTQLIFSKNLANVLYEQHKYFDVARVVDRHFPFEMFGEDPAVDAILRSSLNLVASVGWQVAMSHTAGNADHELAARLCKASAKLRGNANDLNNYGVALYQVGNYQAASQNLEKADGMIEGGDREHRMFLAMAHWQLRNSEKAREYYDQGVAWQEEQADLDDEQIRFRRMAEELMGIEPNDLP